MQASGYNVQIYLKDNSLIYQCGNLKFKGVYTDLIESKNMLVIDVNITNQKSIDFKFRLNVDKKSETILMTGLSGVPETNMQKSDLVLYRH